MPTTWTNDVKLSGQASQTYDNSSITYDDAIYNYGGQEQTVWSNDPKN